ncbi:MAG: aminomethyl-transferring glycine dehydrogenase [Bacteroidetes bacterium]|nr:aminomethyl-transferring glycine dehydrogenase [Bacteroidota bacterium]
MINNNFVKRHNGPREAETDQMLKKMKVASLDALIDETVPRDIRLKNPLSIGTGMNEYQYLAHIKNIASKNKIFKTYIGQGYYNTISPAVITRNILENAGWYTSYTPYQAEISQGRLEALLNFQTMVADLTGLPIVNASLLDEATAAAEAMIMLYNSLPRAVAKSGANQFFVSDTLFLHTIEVLKNRALPLGIELLFGDHNSFQFNEMVFGAIIQYPDQEGAVKDYAQFVEKAHQGFAKVVVAADIMSLTMLTPPGEWGADVTVGSTQRFGIPMGFGGPHAAFFATTESFKRNIPGRIIGVSQDANGDRALRMALQTREQHIKRERATSNICTAQALLATMAGMYAVYHGPEGLKDIAEDIHSLAVYTGKEMVKYGYEQLNEYLFDTLKVELPAKVDTNNLKKLAEEYEINFRYIDDKHIGISFDETTHKTDIKRILTVLAKVNGKRYQDTTICKSCQEVKLPKKLIRSSEFLTHKIFNSYHSETEMMRYIKKLEIKDLALNRAMIPLGSCTMKLNAGAEMLPISWAEFGAIHPFVPKEQVEGYTEMIDELSKNLCEITGFAGISFMPNSGASGEYTGLMVIREYHKSRNEFHRNICLIPSSAHGTNPASAVMAGMKVVVTKCDENGNIDLSDVRAKAEKHKEHLGAAMVTYPSTHGVFEEGILEVMDIIHENGGQVYMDGANMNAQVGLTSPGFIGADVCHLNLHKTFAIPHGGGGPGVGPIGVAAHLVKFLPVHLYNKTGGENGILAISAAPFGSAMVLPISYGYIKLLGGKGLTEATKYAILNANYLKTCLEEHYKILYTGKHDRVAHEMILDCNKFHTTANVPVIDIAKRLMDYGFHAPTVAFPVHGTLMVEPTESEPLYELDRFVDAMIAIREEIKEIEDGNAEQGNNVVCNAPHTAEMATSDDWKFPYTRQKAVYPKPWSTNDKYWPAVTKVDDAYGDRNLVCTCLPIKAYEDYH